ncbi:MAG: dienelactone hydrolase family protein, partial [Thiobacillus sp.]|nr:dienelactone hydrolase family protein [Thiobacillus sp.]
MKTALALSLLFFTTSALAAVVGKDVTYKAGETAMKGYLVYDDAVKGRRAGVLVVPEWWGANDYAKKRARMLAEAGYVAMVVDMYGNGQVADNPKDAGALAGSVNRNPPLAYARFDAARAFLD